MQALLLIGGWADSRFVDWLLHGPGRAELLALIATVVVGIALWRIAVRNAREHAADAARATERHLRESALAEAGKPEGE